MYKFYSLILWICIIHLTPLAAEPAVIISLANVSDRIRAQNPDLAAARLRIKEALGRVNQAGRLANPELEVGFQHNQNFREGGAEVGLAQKFPTTNRLLLEKTISLTELKAAEAEVREVQRQLVGQARERMVKILANRERRDLLREQIGLAQQFSDFLTEVAKKGEGSALDAGQAKLEASKLTLEMRQLEASETALLGELKPLLGMGLNSSVSISGDLTNPQLPANAVDPSRRPDFQMAKLGVSAASQGVALEQAKRYEDLEGGVFTGLDRSVDEPDGAEVDAIVGVKLKVPLPWWNRNEGAIQEAQAKKQRKEKEAIALSRGIRLEAEAAQNEMAQWAQLSREVRENLLPLAKEQENLAETAYRSGQTDIQAVLRAREKHSQLAVSHIDALREFHLARVRYETAIAKP